MFAFWVKKIVVRKRTGDVVRIEPYVSGAMYEDAAGGVREDGPSFVVDEEACEEASVAEDDDWEMVLVDGEEILCVKPWDT